MVNGQRVEKPKRLRSGYRIILGDFHIFRFNHPQEARAERAEQGSLLRHSVIASQLSSPSPRMGHERTTSTVSRAESELDFDSPRTSSPAPFQLRGRDSDWSFARREAVTALLGPDQKINNLTDEELDVLFDDLQRDLQKVKAIRKARPESRLFDGEDFDLDSEQSYPFREKYASNGTLDNFSLDTALTVPSTPQLADEDERLRIIREDMQSQLDKQKDEYQAKLKLAGESNTEIEEIRAEKVQMEENLLELKAEMQKQLDAQKEEFERQIREQKEEFSRRLQSPEPEQQPDTLPATLSTDDESSAAENRRRYLIERSLEHWREQKYVAMAETVLQNASILKEAQVMSQQMDKNVVFQFCIVEIGHCFASSYDLVLNGVPYEDDEDLDDTPKPCVGVRVVDFKNHVVHLWSLEKLQRRVRQMRQMHQYLNRPEYLQHFRLENPFSESCQPEFSRVGDADVPLAAVFEFRVQDFTLDVISPYTSNVIGIARLSLEPSSAEAPSSTLKFNVVMRDFAGFPEREGTDVHAQLFVPGISEEGGATTTQMIKDFDEGPIRFESVHSMSLPLDSPRSAALRVSIFARVTDMHLDKLLSWDDMRDSAPRPKQKRRTARIPETEFLTEETHDIFARIQIHEIFEDGTYQPTDVLQTGPMDAGAYQLHQGLQRRIVVHLSHTSGDMLKWEDVTSIQVGRVHLVDSDGSSPSLDSPQQQVPVKLVSTPTIKKNSDGTSNVAFTGHWDSSMHNSLLLDRSTSDKYRVQVTLSFSVACEKLGSPMTFSHDLVLQIRSRAYIRQASILSQFLNPVRIVHSTVGIFSVTMRPMSAKRATDLWRMSTKNDYVKGEEMLSGWTPRGVSLVRDFIDLQSRRRRIAEIETARSLLSSRALSAPSSKEGSRNGNAKDGGEYTPEQTALLTRVLELWQKKDNSVGSLLSSSNIEPPAEGAAFAPSPTTAPGAQVTMVASVRSIPKNPALLKGGYLWMPDTEQSRWVRRFVELRRPYLHVYSVPEGDELHAINLSNARVDHQPQVARLIDSGRTNGNGAGGQAGQPNGTANVFAVWARENAWLFRAPRETDKIEWILRIDQSYFSNSPSDSETYE